MRLIDADKLILHLNDYALQVAPFDELEPCDDYITVQECIKAVDEQPTAYDVDKVVKQIQNVHLPLASQTARIVKIVRKGGDGSGKNTNS